jgi:hypothetical protein
MRTGQRALAIPIAPSAGTAERAPAVPAVGAMALAAAGEDVLNGARILIVDDGRFCQRLPELVPPTAPVLLHGDLWRDNVLAGPAGRPTLIDPAVWYGWPEADISTMWLLPRPAASDRIFSTWEAIARPEPGWTDRAPLLHVREMLSALAQFGDEHGTADRLRTVLMPFRRRA